MTDEREAVKRLDELVEWINCDRSSRAVAPAGWDEVAWTTARTRLPSRVDELTERRSHEKGVAWAWAASDLGRRRLCCAVEEGVVVGLSVRPPEDVRPWAAIAPTGFTGDESVGAAAVEFARASEVPGCVVGKAGDGERAIAACGYSDLADLEPMLPSSVFRLSSVTKVLTTIATLRLVRDGELALETPIANVLDIPAADKVTVQHLLTHTSGLKFDGWVHVAEGEPELCIEDCTITHAAPPGTKRLYANQGFALLGRAIERCTGQPWVAHIQQTILEPLGTTRTVLSDPPGFPDGFVDEGDAIVPEDRYTPGYGPAAAGWTTARDLLVIGQALVDPDRGLVDHKMLSLINHSYVNVDGKITQGLGLLRFTANGGDVLFHSGGWPGWSAALAVRVRDRAVAVVGANRSVDARFDWPLMLLGSE
ncbi:MAG: hypothetical protein QOK28_3040 [Actinomycetota bacterium]|jgi:CubicO group peptidase (beta-lactamase class C family)